MIRLSWSTQLIAVLGSLTAGDIARSLRPHFADVYEIYISQALSPPRFPMTF
jgi:hypothetical protein